MEAALATLQWGGVTANNTATLRELGGDALPTFRDASRLLAPRGSKAALSGSR